MSADEISQNGLNSQLVFQDFNCGPPSRRVGGDPPPKSTTRELPGFIDDKLFTSSSNSAAAANDRFFPSGTQFPRNMYRESRNWKENGNEHGSSGDESDGDEDDDEDDDDMDDEEEGGDGEHDNSNSKSNNNNANDTAAATGNTNGNVDKVIGNGNGKSKQHHSSFGEMMMVVKDGGGSVVSQIGNNNNNNNNSDNVVTIAEPDGEIYYSQYLQANEGSGSGGKDLGLENGCGFSGRKDASSFSCESGDSLRAILSDPVTGTLMDDAMILPCGHSFGAGGIQHIIRMKACYTCSQSVTEDSVAPNISLRAAVQAFRREEELQFYRSSKRKRDRFDQEKGGFGDSTAMDVPRGRGVQFPFAVTDRVIIKGNKRTPQRFVGREAVVTTQCLNGWYVVKTLDNAESVKLQYRSLAKVSDEPSTKAITSKMPPNWL